MKFAFLLPNCSFCFLNKNIEIISFINFSSYPCIIFNEKTIHFNDYNFQQLRKFQNLVMISLKSEENIHGFFVHKYLDFNLM